MPSAAEKKLDAALSVLRERQLRITEPRKAMLRALIAEHGPFTSEEVHARLPAGQCDLVTVYRSLQAMEEAGVLRRCDFGDHAQRYEFNAGEHHHHHIICRACGKAETLDLCVVDSLERIVREKGYANVSHVLELFGICRKCQATRH